MSLEYVLNACRALTSRTYTGRVLPPIALTSFVLHRKFRGLELDLEFRTMEKGKKKTVILCVIHHRQNPLEV
jgi:hypothetical protein